MRCDMPISVIYVLQVFSMAESLLPRFCLAVPEPQNHQLNKDAASASCHNQYQILNIKRLRRLYLAVLLLGQVNC
jgi:hypothetical protein